MWGAGDVEEPHPQIVAAARRGDVAAFERLVRLYQADIWRLCFHLVGDRTMADDVTQEVFLRAHRFLGRYRGDSKFSTWMFSVARNCCFDEIRRAGRRRRVAQMVEAQPPQRAADPHRGLEVREAVAELSLELREAVVLIDALGHSYAEVAELTRVPLGTVKSRVHRARELLAHRLADHGEGADEA